MSTWLIIILASAACMAAGLWALSGGQDAKRQAYDANESIPAASQPVNTTVAPLEESRPLARLDFGPAAAPVAVRRGELVIGRHSAADVRIPDVRVSRHHARLVVRARGDCEIHNLTAIRSDPNPMLVNGIDREHARIEDGDEITLGGVTFKVRFEGAAA